MIDSVQVANKLKSRFGSIAMVRPGVFRASEKFGDREYAVRYFDASGGLGAAAQHLREYQEDLMTETYFGEGRPADLRWNHYLYFIASDEEAKTSAFREIKTQVEGDRTYARKAVLTEHELDALLTKAGEAPEAPPVDLARQWNLRLDTLGLSFVLDDAVSAPEAARLIKAGRKQPPAKLAAPAALSDAEKAAASKFLQTLTIAGFRTYPVERTFNFGDVNLIFGRNGAGKTSLLEAIEFLYCGENRRVNDQLRGTRITGKFSGSNARLTTSAAIKLADLRTRNIHWYAKADVRKSTLADSFGRFNFLDTDAAVDLSNNNDSEDRLKRDVARLLLGAEAEKLSAKLERVKEKVDDSVRDSERDVVDTRRRIGEARVRLEAIRKSPQTSDALFASARVAVASCGWKTSIATKQDAANLNSLLQAATTAAGRLARARADIGAAETSELTRLRFELGRALEQAEALAGQVKKLLSARSSAEQTEATLRSRQSTIEVVARYLEVGYTAKCERLDSLTVSAAALGARLAAVDSVLTDPSVMPRSNASLVEALADIDAQVQQWSVTARERTSTVKAIEATMASVTVLRQRLLSTASELLGRAADPDHCPVCRTHFESGQLKLRMLAAGDDDSGQALPAAQVALAEATRNLAQATAAKAVIAALVTFVQPRTDLTIDKAYREIERARATLERDRSEIKELQSVIAQLAQIGLTKQDLGTRVAALGLSSVPSQEELGEARSECLDAVAKLTKSSEEREATLTTSRSTLAELSGVPMASGDALPDAQVEHLRGRLSDFDLLVSSAQMLESVLDRRVRSDIPLELRLEQASDQTSRLVAALQAEAHASASAEAEMRNVAALEERLAEYSQQGDRMRDARQLMNDLLEQAKAGVFADQVIRANATTIGSIFAAIHSPNEFSVEVGQTGALSIVRRDTSQVVSLHQMSTGQRSAYALALFLSMNSRLTAGPPLVLLDDPIAHIDDLNILSFLDHLRDIAVVGSRQIFLATANDKLAGLFRQKFRFMGDDRFRELPLSRN